MQFGREHEEIARGQRWQSGSPGYRSQGYGSQNYGPSPQWSPGEYGEGRWQPGRGYSGESGGYGWPGYGSQGYESREFGYPSGWGYGQERFGESFGRGSEGIDRSAGRYTGRGPKGYTRSDDRIKEDVNDRLEQHGEIDAWEISVVVQNGEVTLEGTVPDRLTKRLAEDVAEDSPGVKQVHNRLRIHGNALTSGETGRSSTGSTGASRTSSGSTSKSSTRT
jgi:hypothetical protein